MLTATVCESQENDNVPVLEFPELFIDCDSVMLLPLGQDDALDNLHVNPLKIDRATCKREIGRIDSKKPTTLFQKIMLDSLGAETPSLCADGQPDCKLPDEPVDDEVVAQREETDRNQAADLYAALLPQIQLCRKLAESAPEKSGYSQASLCLLKTPLNSRSNAARQILDVTIQTGILGSDEAICGQEPIRRSDSTLDAAVLGLLSSNQSEIAWPQLREELHAVGFKCDVDGPSCRFIIPVILSNSEEPFRDSAALTFVSIATYFGEWFSNVNRCSDGGNCNVGRPVRSTRSGICISPVDGHMQAMSMMELTSSKNPHISPESPAP